MEWKLELVAVPVSDVDHPKASYAERVDFNADQDHRVSEEVRFVRLKPPGSACSIAIGTRISQSEPGSVQGLQMVVSDVNTAREELAERRLGSARSSSSHFGVLGRSASGRKGDKSRWKLPDGSRMSSHTQVWSIWIPSTCWAMIARQARIRPRTWRCSATLA